MHTAFRSTAGGLVLHDDQSRWFRTTLCYTEQRAHTKLRHAVAIKHVDAEPGRLGRGPSPVRHRRGGQQASRVSPRYRAGFIASPIASPYSRASPNPLKSPAITNDGIGFSSVLSVLCTVGSQAPVISPVATAETLAAMANDLFQRETSRLPPLPWKQPNWQFRLPSKQRHAQPGFHHQTPATSTRRALNPATPCTSVSSSVFPVISPDS